jgi:hypothetical protein
MDIELEFEEVRYAGLLWHCTCSIEVSVTGGYIPEQGPSYASGGEPAEYPDVEWLVDVIEATGDTADGLESPVTATPADRLALADVIASEYGNYLVVASGLSRSAVGMAALQLPNRNIHMP